MSRLVPTTRDASEAKGSTGSSSLLPAYREEEPVLGLRPAPFKSTPSRAMTDISSSDCHAGGKLRLSCTSFTNHPVHPVHPVYFSSSPVFTPQEFQLDRMHLAAGLPPFHGSPSDCLRRMASGLKSPSGSHQALPNAGVILAPRLSSGRESSAASWKGIGRRLPFQFSVINLTPSVSPYLSGCAYFPECTPSVLA